MIIWKDIPGYEGRYQASNTGMIRSLNYRGTGQIRELRLREDKDGYLQVNLSQCGVRATEKVHRLIVVTFLKSEPGKAFINHIDENKSNNAVSNLEWCDARYNLCFNGLRQRAARKRNKAVVQFDRFGYVVGRYPSIKAASQKTGVNNISDCCRGKYQSSGGYSWRFEEDVG